MTYSANKTSISWEFINQFSFHNPPEIVLLRSPEVQKKYILHSQELKRNNCSVTSFLRNKFFPRGDKDVKFIITPNQFPYDTDVGINHYLIWFNPDLESCNWIGNFQKVKEIVQEFCRQENIDEDNSCIFFQNLECMRSVKAIPHVHIFWKKE